MMGIAGSIAAAVKKGVPGIPLGALDAIQDENARLVLRSIVDGWHVRNGNSGNGDGAFVTRAEIDGLVSAKATQTAQNFLGSLSLSPGEISRVLADLHSQVFESQLFRALEARVDLIDKPGGIFDQLEEIGSRITAEQTARATADAAQITSINSLLVRTSNAEASIINETQARINGDTANLNSINALGIRVGDAETAIKNEITQRVNADNALQTSISTQYAAVNNSLALQQQSITTNANNVAALTTQYNQIQASVNGLSAALRQESEVRANADGDLYAQWTLRVDVNGRVSGIGLAADKNSSDFIVRSDRFSLVSPDGSNRAALIMMPNMLVVYDENGAARVRIGRLS